MKTESISLKADDGHELDAYVAHPEGAAQGGIVVIQEIFGITGHIRAMTEAFAEAGYLAVAPAMYDRVSKGLELGYDDFDAARRTMAKLEREESVLDMKACTGYAAQAGKVGIIGFCWGGAMADLAACHGLVSAGVSYYGRMTAEWLDLTPTCPMLYHYGDRDQLIPMELVEKIQRKRAGTVRVWGNADHGFMCEERPSYAKRTAAASMEVTLEFFAEHLG